MGMSQHVLVRVLRHFLPCVRVIKNIVDECA
jgi:hypothetical protein